MRVIVKKRDIKLDTSDNSIVEKIPGIPGVSLKKMNRNETLHLEYDLMKVNLNCIENTLKNAGILFSKSFWSKFKRDWINYTEENEYVNITAAPHACCNSDPTENV